MISEILPLVYLSCLSSSGLELIRCVSQLQAHRVSGYTGLSCRHVMVVGLGPNVSTVGPGVSNESKSTTSAQGTDDVGRSYLHESVQ